MIAAWKRFADNMLGRGEATVTVPPFDGALKPNQLLETAQIAASFDAPEDLASDGATVYVANGPAVLALDGASPREIATFRSCDHGALRACRAAVSRSRSTGGKCACSPRPPGPTTGSTSSAARMNAVNALSPGRRRNVAGDRRLARAALRALGARPDGERQDRAPSVARFDERAQVREIAGGLAFAFGACAAGDDVLVSESWRHRVHRRSAPDGGKRAALDNLPAYPSRISPAASGGGSG